MWWSTVTGRLEEAERLDPAAERVGRLVTRLLPPGPVKDALHGRWLGHQRGRPDPPAAGRLGEIRVPTLVVVGAEDVPDVVDSADPLVHAIPGAKRATIAGAAHLPNMEKPEEFNRIVLTFLDEIDIG